MTHHIGIDLGTTNSAVCLYDGENVRLFKSPEQNDVTPSAIFFTKRGNKYVGRQAYDNAARDADSAATLFKRLMGTSTPVKLSAVNLTMLFLPRSRRMAGARRPSVTSRSGCRRHD